MTHALIDLAGIGLTLRNRAGAIEILRDVSLSIESGEAVAIVGPSGSGKTSLLMIMAGLERATQGRVVIDGTDVQNHTEDELATIRGQKIGIVFQSFHLVPTMTALENAALALELAGAPDAEARAASLLADVGLSARTDHFPAEMSGGEQQRVALARALSTRPRILLADEPTGNLDGATGRQVIDLLFGLSRTPGSALVLVTHDETLARRCSRIVRMADGRIVSDERAEQSTPRAGAVA